MRLLFKRIEAQQKMIVEFRDLFHGGIWSLDHILLVTMHPGPSDCAQNNSFKL